MIKSKNCTTCFHEQVEKLKSDHVICKACIRGGNKDNPFPGWVSIPKEDKTNGKD